MKTRNRTLEGCEFTARKQKSDETLRQFWNVLTGLASKCEFREQTGSLMMDAFLESMNNLTVRLCTEPKETPEQALRLAIASRQQNYGSTSRELKTEPVMALDEQRRETHALDAE